MCACVRACACVLTFDENTVLYFTLFVQMCSNALLCEHKHCIVAVYPQNRVCMLAIDNVKETRLWPCIHRIVCVC